MGQTCGDSSEPGPTKRGNPAIFCDSLLASAAMSRPSQPVCRAALLLTLLVSAAVPAAAAPAPAPQAFALNGWQLHDYNLPKLEDAIRRARGYGVNLLIFSHEMFRSV